MASIPLLIHGPPTAPATLLLAHGAGAPMDSPFMNAIALGLAQRGWRVARFEFPYMARRRLTGRPSPPDGLPKLLESFRAAALAATTDRADGPSPLFIGGKSLGGRVASLLVDALAPTGVRGCFCLGFPFHPPGKPQLMRGQHLASLATPTLILQGERDPFGRREELATLPVSPSLRLEWLASGDHSFKPNRASGLSEADNWAEAVVAIDRFCKAVLADAAEAGPVPLTGRSAKIDKPPD